MSPSRSTVLFAAVFACALGWRAVVIMPTLDKRFAWSAFRVGEIPWSDARGWFEGPELLLSGQTLRGVPARRPLYPAYLAVVSAVVSLDYRAVGLVQALVAALSIALTALILRPVRPRLSAHAFIALLVVWRPDYPALFLTENLGMALLGPAVALLWRAVAIDDEAAGLAGLFLFELGQAVRPWPLVCLLTLPFVACSGKNPWRLRLRRLGCGLAVCLAGYAVHALAGKVLTAPGEGASYYGETALGIASGQGWIAAKFDPELRELRHAGASPQAINRAACRRAWAVFQDDPLRACSAIARSFGYYLRWLPKIFDTHLLAGLILVLVVVVLGRADPTMPGPGRRAIWLPALLCVAFAWTTLGLAVAGIIWLRRRATSLRPLIGLWFLGVLASLPWVGLDGGSRVRIANDLLIFLCAALGTGALLREPQSESTAAPNGLRELVTAAVAPALLAVILLVVVPAALRFGSRDSEPWPRPEMTAAEAATMVSPTEIDAAWEAWPEDSLTALNDRQAWLAVQFQLRDCVGFAAGDGLSQPLAQAKFWPLAPLALPRTIYVRERRMVMFPHLQPADLATLDGMPLLISGRLKTRPRRQYYDTGAVLVAQRIGYVDGEGQLTWLGLDSSP